MSRARRDHLADLIAAWNDLSGAQKVALMQAAPEVYSATAWLVRETEARRGRGAA